MKWSRKNNIYELIIEKIIYITFNLILKGFDMIVILFNESSFCSNIYIYISASSKKNYL